MSCRGRRALQYTRTHMLAPQFLHLPPHAPRAKKKKKKKAKRFEKKKMKWPEESVQVGMESLILQWNMHP